MERIYIDGTLPQWKSNFHIHSKRSDGKHDIDTVVQAYKDAGYHVIMPSDHNVMWNTDVYDDPENDFITMRGTEVNLPGTNGKPNFPLNGPWWIASHLLIIWDDRKREACPVRHDERITNAGHTGVTAWNRFAGQWINAGFYVIYCHPRWSKVTPELMLAVENCHGVEIYNHESEMTEAVGYSEAEIDYALMYGKEFGLFGTDDMHHYLPQTGDNFRGGYTMITAPELTREAISHALFDGTIYASEGGPCLHDMRVIDGVLHIQCDAARQIRIIGAPQHFQTKHTDLTGAPITSFTLEIPEGLTFLRAEIVGFDGRKTWSPVVYGSDLD